MNYPRGAQSVVPSVTEAISYQYERPNPTHLMKSPVASLFGSALRHASFLLYVMTLAALTLPLTLPRRLSSRASSATGGKSQAIPMSATWPTRGNSRCSSPSGRQRVGHGSFGRAFAAPKSPEDRALLLLGGCQTDRCQLETDGHCDARRSYAWRDRRRLAGAVCFFKRGPYWMV